MPATSTVRFCRDEPEDGGSLGKQSSDSRILELDQGPAAIADEEKAIVFAFGMDARNVGVQAFNFGDETLCHQEVKGPVYGWRSDRPASR